MKDALHNIVASIVDNPDEVRIEEQQENDMTTLVMHVSKDDMGKIIGKEGKVIRAIRNVMKMKAMKHNIRINVAIAENATETTE